MSCFLFLFVLYLFIAMIIPYMYLTMYVMVNGMFVALQERERRRQHMMLIKVMEARKRAEVCHELRNDF